METFLGRYRNLNRPGFLLFVQALGLAVQIKRTSGVGFSRLIRIWAVGAVSPSRKLSSGPRPPPAISGTTISTCEGRARGKSRGSSSRLNRCESSRCASRRMPTRPVACRPFSFQGTIHFQTMAAQSFGSTGSEQSRGVYLDKGEKDGIRPDMAASPPTESWAKCCTRTARPLLVLLISDPAAAWVRSWKRTRLQGILRGMPSGEIALEKVMSDEQVPPGELVLSSGWRPHFSQRALPIGRVKQVSPGSDLFLNIQSSPPSISANSKKFSS